MMLLIKAVVGTMVAIYCAIELVKMSDRIIYDEIHGGDK